MHEESNPEESGYRNCILLLSDVTHFVYRIMTYNKMGDGEPVTEADQCHILLIADEHLKHLSVDFFGRELTIALDQNNTNCISSIVKPWYKVSLINNLIQLHY